MPGPASFRSGRRRLGLAAIACLLLAALVQGRMEARAAGQPEIHPILYLPSGRYLKFASLGFDGTDTFRFEAFENRISEPAIFSTNLTAGAGAPDFTFGRAWQDLQGVFRVTMLSGSAVLPGFFGSVVTTNGLYSLKVQVAPRLIAARSFSQVRLSWTTNASGYRLESTDSLPASGWSTVTNSTAVSGGEFVVDVGLVPVRRYFRLRRP